MVTRDDFLSLVLPSEGYVCVTSLGLYTKHTFYDNADSLIGGFPEQRDGENQFFATFSFTKHERKQEFAHKTKLLWVDMDVAPNDPKKQSSKEAAVTALSTFCETSGYPLPNVLVDSGGGVHAYWVLDREVTRDEWLPAARQLKALATQHKFAIDFAVTADSARVLRVPGTTNFKNGNPCRVLGVLSEAPAIFDDLPKTEPFRYESAQYFDSDPVTAVLISQRTARFEDILRRSEGSNGCNQLAAAISNQQQTSEPIWRGVLSVIKHCTDADVWAHVASCEHPGYDPEKTLEKMAPLTGPYRCVTFETLNPEGCEGCKHKGKITSPILLSRRVSESPVSIEPIVPVVHTPAAQMAVASPVLHSGWQEVPLPAGYGYTTTGQMFERRGDDETVFFAGRISVVDFVKKPNPVGMSYLIQYQHPMQKVRTFEIQAADMQAVEACRRILAREGLVFLDEEFKSLRRFLQKSSLLVQSIKAAPEFTMRFGWQEDDSFVYGPAHIQTDGSCVTIPSLLKDSVGRALRAQGTLNDWLDVASAYSHPGLRFYRAAWLIGASSVLYGVVGLDGVWLSLYAGSGTGKTTLGQFITSVYGDPDLRDGLPMVKEDTNMSRINRLGRLNSFPAYIDEVTNLTPEALSDISYQVTQGRGRHRMMASANEERENETRWNTCIITTSNASILEKMKRIKATPEGELYRIVEVHLQGLENTGVDWSKASNMLRDKMFSNYGQIGIAICPLLVTQKDVVKELFDHELNALSKLAPHHPAERYWLRTMAAALAFGQFLKINGLMPYDVEDCRAALMSILQTMRAVVGRVVTSPESVLTDFFNAHKGEVVVLRAPADNGLVYVPPSVETMRKISGRFDPQDGVFYALRSVYDRWLSDRNIVIEDNLSKLSRLNKYKGAKKYNLTKGVANMPDINSDVYMFEMKD